MSSKFQNRLLLGGVVAVLAIYCVGLGLGLSDRSASGDRFDTDHPIAKRVSGWLDSEPLLTIAEFSPTPVNADLLLTSEMRFQILASQEESRNLKLRAVEGGALDVTFTPRPGQRAVAVGKTLTAPPPTVKQSTQRQSVGDVECQIRIPSDGGELRLTPRSPGPRIIIHIGN